MKWVFFGCVLLFVAIALYPDGRNEAGEACKAAGGHLVRGMGTSKTLCIREDAIVKLPRKP